MRQGLAVLVVLLVLAVGIGAFFIQGLNRVVQLNESVTSAWAQVENQLQRRNDLIPNLVETVKGYAAHEKEVFEHVADARAKLAGLIQEKGSVAAKIGTANELSSALARLLVVVENYPALRANENFLRLQDELSGTENRLAVERMRYNEAVRILNTHIRQIPGSWFASIKNLSTRPYFETAPEAEEAPKVEF